MKLRCCKPAERDLGTRQAGSARSLSLVLGCFLLGVATSAAWFYFGAHSGRAGKATDGGEPRLTEASRLILQHLPGPVEVRYYALLDPATTPESLRAFAGRAGALLNEYQQQSEGRLKVTRYDSLADDSQGAAADGLRAFNLSRGEACYLGVCLMQNGHKETLALAPEWEPALESDLSRALQRLAASGNLGNTPGPSPQLNADIIREVKRVFPNLASVSLEEGTRQLREAGLKQAQVVAAQIEQDIQQAQQRVLEAQNGGSKAQQDEALKQLRQFQEQQVQNLKESAARVEAQVAAFQQLKKGDSP